jgi:hypothetical protein
VIRNLQLDESLLDRRQHAEVPAAGAPVGIDFAFHVGERQLLGLL